MGTFSPTKKTATLSPTSSPTKKTTVVSESSKPTNSPSFPPSSPPTLSFPPSNPPTFSPFKTYDELKEAVLMYVDNVAGSIEKYGPIISWDVSNVVNMSSLFYDLTSFNGDLSGWDVSRVGNMKSMFFGATDFNANISGWDVSR